MVGFFHKDFKKVQKAVQTFKKRLTLNVVCKRLQKKQKKTPFSKFFEYFVGMFCVLGENLGIQFGFQIAGDFGRHLGFTI